MNQSLSVFSEVAPLQKVLLHRPGAELLNLSPDSLSALLFDDIPFLEQAQKEHDEFKALLENNGVEVIYLEDLLRETLQKAPEAKDELISQWVNEAKVEGQALRQKLSEYLLGLEDLDQLIALLFAGLRKEDLALTEKECQSLADKVALRYEDSEPLLVPPIPNLYFTRDCFSVIGNGVSLNSMYSATRSREELFARCIFSYHPEYKHAPRWFDAQRTDGTSHIEGGDILVLSEKSLAIGVSERTDAAAIDCLAKNLLHAQDSSFEEIYAIAIPKKRSFMHLDTVLTQLDEESFAVHPAILEHMQSFRIRRAKGTEVAVETLECSVAQVLAEALGQSRVRLINCGGTDPIASAREQWNDGSNTLALAPGKIMVYQRNVVTNTILYKEGFDLLEVPSSELSRGRGGPHCMSMPLVRSR